MMVMAVMNNGFFTYKNKALSERKKNRGDALLSSSCHIFAGV